ncbi:OmpA family protein [Pseudoflavitalea sp. G-6-1-2]|uniref:OmpA family protein n=1 Tax=Pseudoflavitalea sp. G-6-1-2 TaxID=2728841 RepID=UPI00146B4CD6|nr:OmpA family protein [Pseudoflavitalea sp. G-6-1-2]NML22740.1 OmpA family protein [Pseudoflavitalea sp. G-6-1-2]
MKLLKNTLTGLIAASVLLASCSSMNKTQKGAVIGTAGGAAVGAVIGKVAGNAALGAIIGAAVGGVTGTVIGKKMDKQAEQIKNEVPGAKVERVGEGIVVEFNDKILFGFDKSDLSPSAEGNLSKLAEVLKNNPDTYIEVQGHTDAKGADAYNMTLSQKRATAVANNLIKKGVSASRVTTKGYGKTAPVATNDTEEGRAQNRRVNFLITANEKMKAESTKEANN